MADVDAAGIIYYASPLRWAEVLLGDWLEQSGHSIAAMLGGRRGDPGRRGRGPVPGAARP